MQIPEWYQTTEKRVRRVFSCLLLTKDFSNKPTYRMTEDDRFLNLVFNSVVGGTAYSFDRQESLIMMNMVDRAIVQDVCNIYAQIHPDQDRIELYYQIVHHFTQITEKQGFLTKPGNSRPDFSAIALLTLFDPTEQLLKGSELAGFLNPEK